MIQNILANIVIQNILANIVLFVRWNFKYLLSGAIGLGLGLIFAWVIWPVQWQGAAPRELRDEYKVLIVNGIAEDQQLLAQTTLSPGAEKILGYLSPGEAREPLQTVNEALALLRDTGENLRLDFEGNEKSLMEGNLLWLQSYLIAPPGAPAADALSLSDALSATSELAVPPANSNWFIRFFSWLSVLILIGGFGWVSFRMMRPKGEALPETVRFNSDLDIEEYDVEKEEEWSPDSAPYTRDSSSMVPGNQPSDAARS